MNKGKQVKSLFECFMEDVQDLNEGHKYAQTKEQLVKSVNDAFERQVLTKQQCKGIVESIRV